jgi:plastocyanin
MASPAAGDTEVQIVAEDIKVDVTEIRIPADTDVTVSLENKGMLEHDWVVDGLDEVMIDILQSGETGSVTFSAEAGEYEYYCSVPGHKEAGMVGTLIVE